MTTENLSPEKRADLLAEAAALLTRAQNLLNAARASHESSIARQSLEPKDGPYDSAGQLREDWPLDECGRPMTFWGGLAQKPKPAESMKYNQEDIIAPAFACDQLSHETGDCQYCTPTQRCPDHGAVHDVGSLD